MRDGAQLWDTFWPEGLIGDALTSMADVEKMGLEVVHVAEMTAERHQGEKKRGRMHKEIVFLTFPKLHFSQSNPMVRGRQ